MLLASKWDVAGDLARLVYGAVRIAFMALPLWLRVTVIVLIGGFVLYAVATRVRDRWRERRTGPAGAPETSPDA
ncbi:hypothetical protein RGF97_28580 [Streptomyces roseicoloratus]|uniref:DUF4349 domain-containing protein n=1 Tax=Streptomyces roseicoloratus TaxID=2508722 RepID=A0ABY9S0N4_9ACTN|nr:hypothetical protein [Streptomyces roseicoloratus]WMX47973.1 hypothetical protein RGF97_28580 [Streptomyces roseicoloratus]